MKPYVLAIDQGTTSSRALVVDAEGRIVATAQREFPQHFPQPGWVEHDPWDIWNSQRATIAEALAAARIAPHELAAVGIANQRETTLLWDRASGEPVARAIVWQDRRTADACERLRAAGLETEISRRTGLLLDPYFAGTKLAWLLEHVPGARRRAERGELAFGTVDSWLAWQLTGGRAHLTDRTNASRTLLFNIHTLEWDDELLKLFGIPRACLPEVVESSMAPTSSGPLARLGDGFDAPLAGIAGDQQAALFGQACFEPGMAKNTYGTGCFLLINTGATAVASRARLITTVACGIGGEPRYALEGAVFVAGAVVQWLRDGLGIIASSGEIEALAASVPDTGGVCFVPAFTGLGSPYWDADARGTIVGLTRGTGRAHLARAALESIAFQSAELLEAMRNDDAPPLVELRVDGGATVNDLLLQFQADLLGVPVLRPRTTETTALGAAYLAGLATGVWPSTDALRGNWQLDRRFEPRMSRDEAGTRLEVWRRAVDRAREWAQAPR